MTAKPLSGITVVETASVLMAPYATQILGDLGAEVIKIEPPTGDSNRSMAPGAIPGLSGMALNLHRNKKSVVLDLKRRAAQDALRRLVLEADVLVTNLRPSSLAEFRLTYEDVREENPRLVYCETHGFRSDSAEADKPAFDDTIQALCGIPALFGDLGLDVRFPPILLADKVAGLTIAYSVLAALVERERSGTGQRVEVPMFDAILSFTLTEHLARATIPGEPVGYSRILTLNRGPHRTSDGWIAMMPYTDRNWRALYEATGHAELLDQPWHDGMRTRLAEADVVYGELKSIIAERTTAEWLAICREHDVPAEAVPRLAEIVEDPELHRGVLKEADHPAVGTYRQIAPAPIFSKTPLADLASPAPLLGENTGDVLGGLGYTADEIAEMSGQAAV